MKRTFPSKTPKSKRRKALEEGVLQQIRDIRALLKPDLLKKMQGFARQHEQAEKPKPTPERDMDKESIDKQKTYKMLMEFMELKKDRQDILKETADMIKKDR